MGETARAAPKSHPRLLLGERDLLCGRPFLVMGVLNLTPDSFSDGGRFADPGEAVGHALQMAAEGADLIDLGAESSRPGSLPVPEEEELARLIPVLRALRAASRDLPLSVDTTKAEVARVALEEGADLINDISAGRSDPGMLPLAAERRVPMILMHMRGEPKTMQENPVYGDAVAEVATELRQRVEAAKIAGVGSGRIVVDPGIGFGKRTQDNLALLAHLGALSPLGCPIMVGVSRKSLIGQITGAPVDGRLPGSLALHVAALLSGARIFRVHDVAEHLQALRCAAAVMDAGKDQQA
jgi:dihydropteroate synthase